MGKKDEKEKDQVKKAYPLLAIQALRERRGRPPRKFENAEEVMDKALEYFRKAVETGESITVTGLAAWLGTTRKTLWAYENGQHAEPFDEIIDPQGDYDAIRNAIKRAKHIAESYSEGMGFEMRNPAFPIFSLKNTGWKDTQTIETVGEVEHRIDPETKAVLGAFLETLRLPAPTPMIDITPAHQAGELVPVPTTKTGDQKSSRPQDVVLEDQK